MKSPPASTDEAKIKFLSKYEAKFRACRPSPGSVSRGHESLLVHVASRMKKAGLYSKKTYLLDIAHGISKRVKRWGWVK